MNRRSVILYRSKALTILGLWSPKIFNKEFPGIHFIENMVLEEIIGDIQQAYASDKNPTTSVSRVL